MCSWYLTFSRNYNGIVASSLICKTMMIHCSGHLRTVLAVVAPREFTAASKKATFPAFLACSFLCVFHIGGAFFVAICFSEKSFQQHFFLQQSCCTFCMPCRADRKLGGYDPQKAGMCQAAPSIALPCIA